MSTPGLVLHHDRNVPPALLGDWLERRGIEFRTAELWHEPFPSLDGAGFVVSLGSEHSAAASEPEWIPREIELLREADAADVPVLGICFGGQSLAHALGGEIHPARPPEVEWGEIESLDPETIPPGRWVNFHFESFTLPPGADLLARSPAGPAAFRHGPHIGVQFHPEATPELSVLWGERSRRDHPEIDPEVLGADGERYGADAARRAEALFEAWWRGTGLDTAR